MRHGDGRLPGIGEEQQHRGPEGQHDDLGGHHAHVPVRPVEMGGLSLFVLLPDAVGVEVYGAVGAVLLPELLPLSELLPELLPPEVSPPELLPPDDSFVNAIPTTSLMI